MRKLLTFGMAAALALPATWFLYEELRSKDGDLPPVKCQLMEGVQPPRTVDDWPGEMLANWQNDVPAALDGLLDVKTGMFSVAACEALYDQGLALANIMDSKQSFSSVIGGEYEFASQLTFSGAGRALDMRFESPLDVELSLGSPAAGHTVERIRVGYFFANQETPEPALDTLKTALIDRFGPPSVEFNPAGNTAMYWLVDENGLSSRGFKDTCGFDFGPDDQLWWKINDTANTDPTRCSTVLQVSFGGNHGPDAPKTARYLRMELYDVVRDFRNKDHLDEIREEHDKPVRTRPVLLPQSGN